MSVTSPEGVALWCIVGAVAWLPFGIILSFAATASPRLSELSGLSCPGDQVVWINTRTGIYHLRANGGSAGPGRASTPARRRRRGR